MAIIRVHGYLFYGCTAVVFSCLQEKKVDYDFLSIDLFAGAHKEPQFLALNVSSFIFINFSIDYTKQVFIVLIPLLFCSTPLTYSHLGKYPPSKMRISSYLVFNYLLISYSHTLLNVCSRYFSINLWVLSCLGIGYIVFFCNISLRRLRFGHHNGKICFFSSH